MDLNVLGVTALRQSCLLRTPAHPFVFPVLGSDSQMTRERKSEPRPVRDGRQLEFRVPCPGVQTVLAV